MLLVWIGGVNAYGGGGRFGVVVECKFGLRVVRALVVSLSRWVEVTGACVILVAVPLSLTWASALA